MMEEVFDLLTKNLGMGHFNAVLLMIIGGILYHGFKRLVQAVESQGQQITTVSTDVKLTQQWQTSHEKEDDRRFQELRESLR